MDDLIFLYLLSLLCVLLIIFELISIKRAKGIVDCILFVLYSLPLYLSMKYDRGGGAAFTWWGYLVIITSFQILVLIFRIIRHLIRKIRKQKS